MKLFTKVTLSLALVACIAAPAMPVSASAATPTGYTNASQVDYKKSGSYVYNWGVRDEDCTFLSSYATAFYTGSYTYASLSMKDGGTSQSTAPQSALYASLKTLMTSKHTHETDYGETRYQYCYTDCEANGNVISCFYTKKSIGPNWDSGDTWNREHTWPNSKGDASGNGENDIMMLRPTDSRTNSGRGNKAYGESSGYYDPDKSLSNGSSVRGDCARIMLYVYTRWGNTGKMWGKDGVIENLNVLLKWMEEDPVDTWEMGRNDAVQAITGTRNVFVDYPEYAWMLFGEEIPTDMVTPSGEAKKGIYSPDLDSSSAPSTGTCTHEYGEWEQTPSGLYQRLCTLCGSLQVSKDPTESKSNCTSVIVSPVAVTLLLAGAYVFLNKKEH